MLLRVGGVMLRYLLIALSRHSEREDFGGLLGVLLLYCHWVDSYYAEVSIPKRRKS